MKTSESIKAISAAVMELQSQVPYIGKDSEGYGYKYSSLPEFNKKVYPVMKELGLSISNAPDHVDGKPALTTLLVHVPTGEFYCSTMPINGAGIKKANDAQQFGAAITYMVRYSNKAILGIASDDDDAECLTEKAKEKTAPKFKAPQIAKQRVKLLAEIRAEADYDKLEDLYQRGHEHALWDNEVMDAYLDKKIQLSKGAKS